MKLSFREVCFTLFILTLLCLTFRPRYILRNL